MNVHGHRLLIATFLTLLSAPLTSAEIQQLQLTQAERSTIESAACQSRHGVGVDRIDARAYGKGAQAAAVAEVHCVPHGRFMENPMHYVVQCSRDHGRWECQGEWNEILVAVEDEQVAVRVEGAISLNQSRQIVQKIANGGMFQGYPLRKALAPPCYVHQGTAREFIDVKCEGWHIIVSTWCPQSDCPRVFSINKLGH